MHLQPISEADKSWKAIKAQWKKEAETAGEDFSTYALGTFAALDPVALEDTKKSGLYGLYDGDSVPAFCQVHRLLMKRYQTPVLRARLVTVYPNFDFGIVDTKQYAKVLVALFSGVVWLSRDVLAADHVHFQMRSPSDSQFFAALQVKSPLSPFSQFGVKGSWAICSLK